MKTYNDLLGNLSSEDAKMKFVLDAIADHKGSWHYHVAYDAELYYKHLNPTIMNFQKFVYNQMGQKVPDIWSANNKIASNWYFYFVTQAVQYLLGNGVTFSNQETKDKLGEDFDLKIQEIATYAKNGSCGFGFWNFDHLDVFSFLEFVPLYDEEDGALKAGIRFWQVCDDKPLRATLYELDGYTDYIKRPDENISVLVPKRAYKQKVAITEIDGELIYDGENYPTFPIVPLHNINSQSELVGTRGTIDAYDLVASELINNVSDGEFIYWILQNCGGMDEIDDAKFIEQLKLTHVAHADGDDGAKVEAHTVDVPFEASETSLARLKNQLYSDFMGLNVESITAGNVTATQIISAYEPLNEKTHEFEKCVTKFINGILAVAGIDDKPSYVRSTIVNQRENIETILLAANYFDDEFIIKRICATLGCSDEVEEIMRRRDAEEVNRYDDLAGQNQAEEQPEEEQIQPEEEQQPQEQENRR